MAASAGRAYHQDYIARIRYSNALPPPPNPPKLLDIPNTGLETYTSAGFATRLAREQPLNIEADAELGMPIDLVGIPGVFEGDDAAIFPSPDPVIEEADRRLLRPLASLGKASTNTSTVSFLRRTEYITASGGTQQRGSSALLGNKSPGPRPRKARLDQNKEEPLQIAKGIVKGFDIAHPSDAYSGPDDGTNIRGAEVSAAEKDAWKRPQHPTKGSSVKLLDAYPVLPDWDGLPPGSVEDGAPPAYMTFKFTTNPLGAKDTYDEAVDVALLRQHTVSEQEIAKMNTANEAYSKDPVHNSRYIPMADYILFLPDDNAEPRAIKRKFDVLEEDPENELYGVDDDMEPRTAFRYNNVRVYETYRQAGHIDDTFEEVAISLHDPEADAGRDERRARKAAYFYPIMQRSMIRQKGKKFDMVRGVAQDADGEAAGERVDALDVRVRDFDEAELDAIASERQGFEAPEG